MLAPHADALGFPPLTPDAASRTFQAAHPVMATPLVVATAVAGATVGFTICTAITGG